jgi:hypothetical protein
VKACTSFPALCVGAAGAAGMQALVSQRVLELQQQYPSMSASAAADTALSEIASRAMVNGAIQTWDSVSSWFTGTPPTTGQFGSPGYAAGGTPSLPNNTGDTSLPPDYGQHTGGNQIGQPSPGGDSNGGSGYGGDDTPNYGGGTTTPNNGPMGGTVAMSVPPSILGEGGKLPPGIGGIGTPIPMSPSQNPNQAAENFARAAFNGQTPDSVTPMGQGWLAKLPDGTSVLYRPAGQATKTDPTTASVDINNPDIRTMNNGEPAKFKFPKSTNF